MPEGADRARGHGLAAPSCRRLTLARELQELVPDLAAVGLLGLSRFTSESGFRGLLEPLVQEHLVQEQIR